jgi:tetratricopeptide (TPR) repeat protein
MAASDVQMLMQAGLDALYQRHDPEEAAGRFRAVLARNSTHYGATLQLAKALDQSGKKNEALVLWKKVLEMAEAAHDVDTARTARARVADVR